MKWIYVATVGVLAVGFAYYLSLDDAQVLVPFPPELSDEPDALMTGFSLTEYSEQGKPLYEINATAAAHYESEGQTEISDIDVQFFSDRTNDWQLQAKQGIYKETDEEPYLQLHGDVRLVYMQDNRIDMAFTTASLQVYPRRQFVKSLSKVSVKRGSSKIHADRFEADLEAQRVRFLSNVDSQVEVFISRNS